MKTYKHDYKKASEAERLLTEATKDFVRGVKDKGYLNASYDKMQTALHTLREYLTETNEKRDQDGDLIRTWDTFSEEQLCQIRDEFAGIIDRTENENDELDIINVCQRLLDDPEYESYEQMKRDTSGTWTEIEEAEE